MNNNTRTSKSIKNNTKRNTKLNIKRGLEKKRYLSELNRISNLKNEELKKMSIFLILSILIIFSIFLYIDDISFENKHHVDFLTGRAIGLPNEENENKTTQTNTVNEKIKESVLFKDVKEIKACIIVPYDEKIYWAYEIIKDNIGTKINKNIISRNNYNEDELYCGGLKNNDFVIKFNSYSSFIKQLDSNSYNSFKQGRGGKDFFILPSSQLEKGGNVICTQEFVNAFCDAFDFLSDEELIIADMSCCINHVLTKEQNNLLKKHLESNPSYVDETGVTKKDSQFPMGEDNYFLISFLIIIFVILIIIGTIIFIIKHKELEKRIKSKKLENQHTLIDYINNARIKGYTDEQIKNSLRNVGWDDSKIEPFFKKK